jgi:L-ascorbate metabolism protein UlaG (beta-lactamase superfamily)
MTITLDWLGVATYRLTIDDLVVFLDAYMDRVPGAPAVGLSAADVTRADFVLVGHSHFDHIAGAEVIAANTGARIIGSHESCRVMRERGVPPPQLLPSQGGERHRLADGVTVRVFPSLHSCTWVAGSVAFDEERLGHLGLDEDQRAEQAGLTAAIVSTIRSGSPEGAAVRVHIASCAGSRYAGGALVYLIETRSISILFQDTSGCWSGVLRDLRPDVAILAAAGRGNLDGEPFQGTLAGFVAHEASLLQPRMIFIGHHDDWMPPVTRDMTDVTPIREAVARVLPSADVQSPPYLAGTRLD